jgi:glycine/D-amino acid oxidase-like deaminating enzyme
VKSETVAETIIVGGGLIGCSIAWRLAQCGHRVHVIESNRTGKAASWAAAGMLAPLIESHHDAFTALATSSIALYPAFVAELSSASGIDAELQLEDQLGSVDNRKLSEAAAIAARRAGAFISGSSAR